MSNKLGRPHVAHSLLNRVRKFFLENPEEELTPAQLATKFDCSLKQAHKAAQYLRSTGVVESVHVIRRPSVGRAS